MVDYLALKHIRNASQRSVVNPASKIRTDEVKMLLTRGWLDYNAAFARHFLDRMARIWE